MELRQTNKKERRPHNTRLPQVAVTGLSESLCYYSASVQVDSFVLQNPPERKARKR